MSNIINTNYTAGIYSNSVNKQAKSSQTETTSFANKMAEKRESAVDQYKRNHPEDVSHVDAQVRAGKSVITKNGAGNVSREDMTMEEYKIFINGLLSSIPFDSTRIYDREIISISDAGWEQMKNDPIMRRGYWDIRQKTGLCGIRFSDGRVHREVFMWRNLVRLLKNILDRV